jgi:site-specific DNA-adenine methylase
MFSYYGSKSKIVHLYPTPKFDKIIEPFAGSARYSLRFWQKDILLVDKYPVIVDVWNYLKNASEKDISDVTEQINNGQAKLNIDAFPATELGTDNKKGRLIKAPPFF